ncbi:hypothetical protein DES53_115102 [Roseimicrobium gellanilyticum]|uniref:Uncharacterized protein n=1 Tax=Roseimicrobium gellanilyticum TaxID=748857 RepID=A0A366H674_9BACT|nr:hypothetical protein [Roseimicrobium gellanilyticum]RBP36961.1 hypothetical protein DES53_115102 [Roseimicrobium gellanilyticum]
MSRRTKLIIAAIFLALLGIPAIHIVHVWHPENPLRFQMVEEVPWMWSDPPVATHFKTIFVKVTNISETPIYMASATLMRMQSALGQRPDIGSINLMRPPEMERTFGAYDSLRVPPHGSLYAMGYVPPEEVPALREKETTGITMAYIWCAYPRLHLRKACEWLRIRLPEAFDPVIPEVEFGRDHSPLNPLPVDASSKVHPPSP